MIHAQQYRLINNPQFKESEIMTNHPLLWKKFPILNDGFICLSDFMGNDAKIASRARTSYGRDTRFEFSPRDYQEQREWSKEKQKDTDLIRRLMRDRHTSPFEFCTVEFLVRAPIYVFRQWHRHRTASINEYSGRYKEMIDSMEVTDPGKWRLQSGKNKQGSDGYLSSWGREPEDEKFLTENYKQTPGEFLCESEQRLHKFAREVYQERLDLGVAKEQA